MMIGLSLDDGLLARADTAAKEIGVSRSRLFSMAVEAYLKEIRNTRMLEQLNRAYAQPPDERERLLWSRMKAKTRAMIEGPR
jgi:metal-responsive CopG/Arc/MetJ family transcriptional regulator